MIKEFSYKLVNFRDTDIVVTTRHKLFFSAKVVESKYRGLEDMSMRDKDFAATSDHYYFLESLYLKISKSDLEKKKKQA